MGGLQFIGSEIYRRSRYGGKHPLAIPRVSLVMDLCRALGWLPDDIYIDSPVATPAQLSRFHDPAYIDAVIACERDQRTNDDYKTRHNLGANGNPVFGEIFRRPATACGATILATELLQDGGIVYSPAGGTHHGQPDRASGFCYFNDPVLGILSFLDQGLSRVAYVDIDAHHCDGVEAALVDDDRVLIASVHERERWPFTGRATDPGRHLYNFDAPRHLNDDEFYWLLHEGIVPAVAAFRPEALIIQGGADALADDPMSKLNLSNNAHVAAVQALRPLAPRLLVLGGGGYNPYAVGRCWSRIWAAVSDLDEPDFLPENTGALLDEIDWSHSRGRNPPPHWRTTLADPPNHGPIRPEVRALTDRMSSS